MLNHKEHIRRHAERHHERHLKLKELLKNMPPKEKVGGLFAATLVTAFLAMAVYSQWESIREAFTPPVAPPPPQTHGFKTGAIASLKIEKQANTAYENVLAKIPAAGGGDGVRTAALLGKKPEKTIGLKIETGLTIEPLGPRVTPPVKTTHEIGGGQALTPLSYQKASVFQKSVLAVYYLGQRPADEVSPLQSDIQILGQLNNALSIDLFAYLNQSIDRSESLNSYLNLLDALLSKTDRRLSDLNAKIAFLEAGEVSQQNRTNTTETAFFDQLKNFDGPTAEKTLEEFINLQENSAESKARLGAYRGLRDYYNFFRTRLMTMTEAVKANRDALIAGVKVTEIQNMTLPLIIRDK